MSSKRCFVIAEIGVNHNGDLDIARRLIDVAADAGADAAKFQTFRADDLIVEGTQAVAYQKKNDADLDQYKLLKSLELSFEDHEELVAHCEARGIEFMSTGFDKGSLRLLVDLGVKRIKIASGEITNAPLVEASAETCLPIVLSTGMATLEEVAECVRTIRAVWDRRNHEGDLVVLHCTSAYPTPLEEVNLAAMGTMARELGEAVGYSDHTTGILVAPMAVAAGAQLIEKHITLDRTMEGPGSLRLSRTG
jgi:N,N'-diacetyllegionaminate synthase